MENATFYMGITLDMIWLISGIIFLFRMSDEMRRSRELPLIEGTTPEVVVQKMLGFYGVEKDKFYLSETAGSSRSISSLAVMLHEVGHAVQEHKNDNLYFTSLFLLKMFRVTSMAAIPGFIFACIFKQEILLNLCIWVYAISGFGIFFMYIVDRDAGNYALKYMEVEDILEDEKMRGLKRIMNIINWSYIQSVFEPIIIVIIWLYTFVTVGRHRLV